MTTTHYPLGTDPAELERLRFQHGVWAGVTDEFLAALALREGSRVVDLGCGPGFVAYELARRVGARGEVVALDESPAWIAYVEGEARTRGLANLRAVRARLQDVELESGRYDALFARWVFSFVPEPGAVLERLAHALRPGGRVLVVDYNHEGVSLFPESAGFRAVVRATRELYRRAGGDAFVAGRAPAVFERAGLVLESLEPRVLCGGPSSPAFQWAGRFFPVFSAKMEAQGLLTSAERAQFLTEWEEHERDPRALFYSPIVVGAIARKR